MPVGLVLQMLAASLVIAVGVIFVAVGAFEEAAVAALVGGWWLWRCLRKL